MYVFYIIFIYIIFKQKFRFKHIDINPSIDFSNHSVNYSFTEMLNQPTVLLKWNLLNYSTFDVFGISFESNKTNDVPCNYWDIENNEYVLLSFPLSPFLALGFFFSFFHRSLFFFRARVTASLLVVGTQP